MRPEILNPLFAEVEALKGVGPGIAKALARLNLERAIDLAYHLPNGVIERVQAPHATGSMLGRIVILDVVPVQVRAGSGKAPLRIYARDAGDNTLTLTFFNNPAWAKKQLPLNQKRTVIGKLDSWGNEWQIVHPEVLEPGKAGEVPLREPVYGLTEGISNKRMRELALTALERAPDLAEVRAWVEISNAPAARYVQILGCATTRLGSDRAEAVVRSLLVRTQFADMRVRNDVIVDPLR